jgi:hypothetical protein
MRLERFAVMQRTSNEMSRGKFQGVSQLDGEGILMPAFSFEKLSPPPSVAAATSTPNKPDRISDRKTSETADKKPRGVIVQVLDRIAEARARRSRK